MCSSFARASEGSGRYWIALEGIESGSGESSSRGNDDSLEYTRFIKPFGAMLFKHPLWNYFSGLLIGSGVCCALIAVVSAFFSWQFVSTASQADARIIRMQEREQTRGHAFAPVFVFRDHYGVVHTVHSPIASYPPKHQVGDTVKVLYSPSSPRDAKINRFFSLWGVPFITGMLALSHLTLGLLTWFWPKFQWFRR